MKLFSFFTIIIFSSINLHASELVGRVILISDGDTLTILDTTESQHKIRLLGIDAPEKSQPYGNQSKQSLSEMVFGKTVTVDFNKHDKYKRIVGKILLEGNDINLEQIKRGLAWHYKHYENEQELSDRSLYANEEYLANLNGKGLWADNNPIPPWEFRKKNNK